MPNIGPLEIAIVLIIVLIIFGPKRLPELGRSLGKGIRDFRGAMDKKDDDQDSADAKRSELETTNAQADAETAEKPAEGEVITERKV